MRRSAPCPSNGDTDMVVFRQEQIVGFAGFLSIGLRAPRTGSVHLALEPVARPFQLQASPTGQKRAP